MKRERISRVVDSESRDALVQAANGNRERWDPSNGPPSAAPVPAVAPPASFNTPAPVSVPARAFRRPAGQKRRSGPMSRACGLRSTGTRAGGTASSSASIPVPVPAFQHRFMAILSRQGEGGEQPACQRRRLEEQISRAREEREREREQRVEDEEQAVELHMVEDEDEPHNSGQSNGFVGHQSNNSNEVPRAMQNGGNFGPTTISNHFQDTLPSVTSSTTVSTPASNETQNSSILHFLLCATPTTAPPPGIDPRYISTQSRPAPPAPQVSAALPKYFSSVRESPPVGQSLSFGRPPESSQSFQSPSVRTSLLRHHLFQSPSVVMNHNQFHNNGSSKPGSILIRFPPSVSLQQTKISSSSPTKKISNKMKAKNAIVYKSLDPDDIYFNRNQVYGERKKNQGVSEYVQVGMKKTWKEVMASLKRNEGQSQATPISALVPHEKKIIPGKVTLEEAMKANYVRVVNRRYTDTPLDFFIKNVVTGLSFSDLQLHFPLVLNKFAQLVNPLPCIESLSSSIFWRLFSTFMDPLVIEVQANELPSPSNQIRVQAAVPESYRKLLITIAKFKTEFPQFCSLPQQLVLTCKTFFESRATTISEQRLIALGRFFGDLLDGTCQNETMNLLYSVMTTRPAATHAFFYGLMCSNPDPFTMLPLPFDYCAISLRDRAVLFAVFQSMKFSSSSHFLAVWEHMKTLGHTHVEISWNEFADNLVHELADCNIERRRSDAAKALTLIFLQAGPDWFYTAFMRMWPSLVQDYQEQKFQVKLLLVDYIRAVASVCSQMLLKKQHFEFFEGSAEKLGIVQGRVKDFLMMAPEICSLLNEVLITEEKLTGTDNRVVANTVSVYATAKAMSSTLTRAKFKKAKRKWKNKERAAKRYVDLDGIFE